MWWWKEIFWIISKIGKQKELQSPQEPHKEEENKATLLGCEPGNLVEEQSIKVSVHEDGKMNNMDDKGYEFFSSHVHLQPSYPWEDENTSCADEDCKMKAHCEGEEFTPRLSVGDTKISAKKANVFNGDKGPFGSYPKEENISYLKSLIDLPKEVGDKPPPTGCKLENL